MDAIKEIVTELQEIEDSEYVLILNDTEGTIVTVEEAIKGALNGDVIEIHYMKYSQDKNNAVIQFDNFWYVGGDIFDVDDFVYCEDTESLINIDFAVWCEDVEDFRHINDTYTDFYGNIYGSEEGLIYSEEKDYYIHETQAVRVYEDDTSNYFWVHCDDFEDYYFWESDNEYHTSEEEYGLIKRYGKTRLSKLDSGSKPYFIGVELEMELAGEDKTEIECNLASAMEDLHGADYYEDLIEYKEDGSLEDGVEMVTAPTSLKQFKKDIVPLIQALKEIGFTSERGSRCGNHIHISRSAFDEQAQARLVLIYARFESIIKTLSRRNGNTGYCKDVLDTVNAISIDNAEEVVKIQKAKQKSTAINFNNSETIEFRVFRGTMNTNVLIANIQLVQLIADLALQELSIQDILDLTFAKLVDKMFEADYKELIQYCEKKEVI